ncbi:hypothetical protein R5B80_18615 [Acinetobacter baumannii]|uniref:hypothetical protein n=1 Tax=Acinetobacter pittii TaxID=48296 RepID=UPI001F05FBBB|nr:hypothetical protein [Acinetobacter pittii]MCH2054813.1 hypothetical protein [Acinetobacter pittii]MDV7452350.1 hypothetical protein [Acinetobacter baumannii]
MQIKPLLLIGLFGFLSGCQVVTNADNKKSVSMLPLHIPDEVRYLNVSPKASIEEKREAYTNQLVSSTEQYATIKTIPYDFFQESGSLSTYPYTLYTFDQKRVKFIKNSMLSPSTTMTRFNYSQSKLKLPVGQHDLVFVSSSGSHSYFTEIKNVALEVNKDYVIGVDRIPNGKAQVFIAEYEIDSKFKPNEPESIIVKKRIIQGIEHGNFKRVSVY